MLKKYSLEILPPRNKGDVTCNIESDEPFLSIHKGDIINPRTWSHHYFELLKSFHDPGEHGIILKVTSIEHMIFQNDEGFDQHKIRIFTEALPDSADSRP